MSLNPYWTGVDEDGKILKELEEKNDLFNPGPENPLYNAALDLVNKKTTTTITNNFAVEWNPWKGVTLRSRIGLSKTINDADLEKVNMSILLVRDLVMIGMLL